MAIDESECEKGKAGMKKRKIISNNYSKNIQLYSTCTSKHHLILHL